jgi:hypothetical protein
VACFDRATERRALDRALRRPLSSAEAARLRATLLAHGLVHDECAHED